MANSASSVTRPAPKGVSFRRHVATLLSASMLLSGCAGYDSYNHVSRAVPPRASSPSGPIMAALDCIKQSGALRNTRIAVAIHADGTGKYNHIAEGSTGNYLPQGTTAVYASEAVLRAGGRPFNYYELNTERAMRAFADAEKQKALAAQQDAVLPNFVLSTSFTSLDFVGGPDVDLQIAGVGPAIRGRGASLEAVAEVYRPGSRAILRTSSIQRFIAFTEVGVTTARFYGGGKGTLVTGGASWSDQQRLQEATRDVVALSVADVLSRFRNVPPVCRAEVEALLAGEGGTQEVAAYAPVANDPNGPVLRVRD